MDRLKKRILAISWVFVLVLGMMAIGAKEAHALSVDEVRTLIHNQVAEEVILNMIATDGTIYITTEEANQFRAMGASENLIAAMRPTPTTIGPGSTYAPSTVASGRQPTVITSSRPAPTPAPVAAPTAVVAAGPVQGSPITPVPIAVTSAYPPRYDKEGWASFSNHDWIPYYLAVDVGAKRMFLSKTPNGGAMIGSGQNLVLNLRKETYKLYGDTGEDLKVKVRENETTTVALNPIGVFGNSGLSGVSVDRDNVRNEVLFNPYVPPPAVVVQESPSVIVVPSPPPRHSYYFDYHRYPRYRRHGGGGFYFRYDR